MSASQWAEISRKLSPGNAKSKSSWLPAWADKIRAVCSQSKLIAEEGVQTCQSAQKLEDKLTDHSSLIMSHILNDDLQTCIILYSSVTHNVNALQQVPTINNTSAWPKYGKTAAKNINVVYLAPCKASAPAILICRAHATLPERGWLPLASKRGWGICQRTYVYV